MNRNFNLSYKISGLLLLIYCVAIFSISSVSHPTRDLGLQKGTNPHLIQYAGLSLLAYLFFLTKKIKTKKSALFALAFSTLFAFSDEFHQYFTPHRQCDIWDIATDITGSSIAIIIAYIFLIFTKITINKTSETSETSENYEASENKNTFECK